jgi:hypothetical protein
MGGKPLTTIERAGVRIEVLAQDGERLNVQCIGCEAPWHNAGGWIQADAVQPMLRALDPQSPLAAVLPERIRWARSRKAAPDNLDWHSLCRIADHGYTVDGDQATWADEDGRITATRREDRWTLDLSHAPEHLSAPWRCALTPPAG